MGVGCAKMFFSKVRGRTGELSGSVGIRHKAGIRMAQEQYTDLEVDKMDFDTQNPRIKMALVSCVINR